MDSNSEIQNQNSSPSRWNQKEAAIVGVQTALVMLLFAALAGSLPPEINEAHYWSKAKHFWDPSWCQDDFFLSSRDAHVVFFYSFGWLTQFLSLEQAVWTGRWFSWAFLAFGWVHLARHFSPSNTIVSAFSVIASAGLFVFLTRNCDLAGEWVVGGVEAKGPAMALSLLSLSLFLQGNRTIIWILAGLASAFHILVGGWIVLCLLMIIAWDFGIRRLRFGDKQVGNSTKKIVIKPFLFLIIGGCISLLGLIPGFMLNSGVDSDTVFRANQIYCQSRLPHHLLINALPGMSIVGFSILVFVFLLIYGYWVESRKCSSGSSGMTAAVDEKVKWIFRIAFASMWISLIGAVLGLVLWLGIFDERTLVGLLKVYWFRCSDFLLPAVVALVVLALVAAERTGVVFRYGILFVMCFLTSLEYRQYFFPLAQNLPAGSQISSSDAYFVRHLTDPIRRKDTIENWRKVCQWIKHNTPDDSRFLTPMHQNTFKWYAHRPEVIVWKDVPQDAQGLLEWSKRTREFGPVTRGYFGYYFFPISKLEQLLADYEADYILMYQYSYELGHQSGAKIPFELVYPEDPKERSTFVVLKVDRL